jgi:hypothetical protein
MHLYVPYPSVQHRVSASGPQRARPALSNDTQLPQQMNGAVSRARLGINRWLARDPLVGYYFAPVWGTIALMARPGKPQFSLGRIFTESSNPSPTTGESSANHRQGLGRGCRTLARGVSFCTRGGLGASHAPIYDTFNVQPRLISRPDPRPARAKVREAVLTVAGGVKQVSFVSA